MARREKYRPRIRLFLFLVNSTILLLPFLAAYFFGFYQDALVRQTAKELEARASLLASSYRELYLNSNYFGIKLIEQDFNNEAQATKPESGWYISCCRTYKKIEISLTDLKRTIEDLLDRLGIEQRVQIVNNHSNRRWLFADKGSSEYPFDWNYYEIHIGPINTNLLDTESTSVKQIEQERKTVEEIKNTIWLRLAPTLGSLHSYPPTAMHVIGVWPTTWPLLSVQHQQNASNTPASTYCFKQEPRGTSYSAYKLFGDSCRRGDAPITRKQYEQLKPVIRSKQLDVKDQIQTYLEKDNFEIDSNKTSLGELPRLTQRELKPPLESPIKIGGGIKGAFIFRDHASFAAAKRMASRFFDNNYAPTGHTRILDAQGGLMFSTNSVENTFSLLFKNREDVRRMLNGELVVSLHEVLLNPDTPTSPAYTWVKTPEGQPTPKGPTTLFDDFGQSGRSGTWMPSEKTTDAPVSNSFKTVSDKLSQFIGYPSVEVVVNMPVTVDFLDEPVWLIGGIVVSKSVPSFFQVLYNFRFLVITVLVVLLVYVVFLSILSSIAITRPVKQLLTQANNALLGRREKFQPLDHPTTREIDALSLGISAMAQELEERAQHTRNFASFISHEFKTPLTSLSGAIEILKKDVQTMPETERNRFISNIQGDTKRLITLVQQYSKLAKAQSLVVDPSQKTNINELLSVLTGRYELSRVQFQIEETANNVFVRMSEDHFDLVISSLIDNAFKHRSHTTNVDIKVRLPKKDKEMIEILITNDGPSIPDDVARQIFEPGYTTSKESPSDGLGLTIVKAHLRAHSGDITLLPTNDRVTFQVTIPLVSA